MPGQFTRVISPNEKLNNMMCLLKVLLGLGIVCGIMRTVYGDFQGLLTDLIACCFLMCALYNMNFTSMAMYLFFCLINEVTTLFSFATLFQLIIQKNKNETKYFVAVSLLFFIVVYYIVACWRAFVTYKEMKALYFEQNAVRYGQGK